MTAESRPLQGSLFGESEEVFGEIISLQNSNNQQNSELNDEELKKDAELRPRKRKESRKPTNPKTPTNQIEPIEDIPSWSHHSLVSINELTPVLRHYVELKIENPERILLYRL